MADFPSFDDLFELQRREILLRNPNLATDAVDRPGADANALVAASAMVGDEIVGQLAEAWAGLWLESSTGTRLDRLAWDRYEMVRKPASVAYGTVEFSTTTPAAAAFTIPAGLELPAQDGRIYYTVESQTFPYGSVGPISVRFISQLTGVAQQLRSGSIVRYNGVLPGAPTDLEVTNVLATAGAADAETDDEFRGRIRQARTAAPPGTKEGIEQKALAFPGVQSARAYAHLDLYGLPARASVLVISDAYTEGLATLNTAVPAYEAQSQALAQTVLGTLDDTRALGIPIQVMVAAVRMVPITLNLTLAATASADTTLRARAALTRYLNTRGPGRAWVQVEAYRVLQGVTGLIITGKEIQYPPGDIRVNPLEVLHTDLALVSLAPYPSL